MPLASPGRSTPVERPNPNARTHWSKRVAPTFRPMVTAPTLLEWARICAVVSVSWPRCSASPMVRSATWISGARSKVLCGVTIPRPECRSAIGPVAYFVDLLHWLANKDLADGSAHTALDFLVGSEDETVAGRRPDLRISTGDDPYQEHGDRRFVLDVRFLELGCTLVRD